MIERCDINMKPRILLDCIEHKYGEPICLKLYICCKLSTLPVYYLTSLTGIIMTICTWFDWLLKLHILQKEANKTKCKLSYTS